MSEEGSKETVVAVSGAAMMDALMNPERAFDLTAEFCSDVSALIQSMHNLYEQHPIEFALLGVQVEVIVRSNSLKSILLHQEFGCKEDMREVLAHPISKEEADGIRSR